jgi:Uma2 family endonuclease
MTATPLATQDAPASDEAAVALAPEDWPNVDDLVTEDDTPVDNLFSEKQQRLLAESLYTAWPGPGAGRPFLVMANVGLFYAIHQAPLVPDVLLSLDVRTPDDMWPKPNRSYFIWMYGKPPDVVIEIVSNTKGGEDSTKLHTYAQIGITHYVIFDPENQLGGGELRVFTLHAGEYIPQPEAQFERIGLGLQLWEGVFEGAQCRWLRWCDLAGNIIPTGAERAEQAEHEAAQAEQKATQAEQKATQAEQKATQAEQKAMQAAQQAEQERQRSERLAAQLRAMGVEPEK